MTLEDSFVTIFPFPSLNPKALVANSISFVKGGADRLCGPIHLAVAHSVKGATDNCLQTVTLALRFGPRPFFTINEIAGMTDGPFSNTVHYWGSRDKGINHKVTLPQENRNLVPTVRK